MAHAGSVAGHPCYPHALFLSGLAPMNNPILNPNAPLPPGMTRQVLRAIQIDPGLVQVASGAGGRAYPPSSDTSIATDNGSFNPADFRRLPKRRHMLLGMTASVFAGAAINPVQWVPQVDVKPNHLIIPSNLSSSLTNISNMLVGAFPQSVSATGDDPAEFSELSTGGMWDLDVCPVGNKITANLSSSGAVTAYSAWTCEAADQKNYSLPRSALKRVGLGATTITAGAAAVVIGGSAGITPQTGFKTRKVMLNANVAGLIITAWQIGINPCFASGDPVPALALSTLAQVLWFDLDEAKVGNGIFLSVYNPTTADIKFSGGLLGDINPADVNAQGGR